MSDKKVAPQVFQVTVEVAYPTNPTIVHASFFKIGHVGDDFVLDVGVLDDQGIHAARAADAPPQSVRAFVTHRFGMSAMTLAALKNRVDEIIGKQPESNVTTKAGAPPSTPK